MAGHKLVVYVVDDEVVITHTLVAILTKAGYLAKGFEKPEEALVAATGLRPDLLITDVVMPGTTGIELAIQFRHAYPTCKILLFSGQSQTFDLLQIAQSQGHNFDLLTKPVHPTDLLAKLRDDYETNGS